MPSRQVLSICRFALVFSLALGHDGGANPGPPPNSSSALFQTSFWGVPKAAPVDHYTTVGFRSPRGSVDEQMQLTIDFAKDPDTVRLPGCQEGFEIFHLPCKCGAELWGGSNANHEFFGNDPHFFGPSRLRVKLTSKTERPFNEGMFQGWASHSRNESPREGSFLLDFYCPTYQLYGRNLVLPTSVTVQIAAFGRDDVQIFDCPEDYDDYRQIVDPRDEMKLKTFVVLDGEAFQNEPYALFSGLVLQAERKVNERTGELFYWALVETQGGCQFDVVIHPNCVKEDHAPKAGSVVFGVFWLSGRLLPEEDS